MTTFSEAVRSEVMIPRPAGVAAAPHPRTRVRWMSLVLLATVAAAGATGVDLGRRVVERYLAVSDPIVPGVEIASMYLDSRPIAFVTTAGFEKAAAAATADALRSDRFLWNRMNVEDWDTVPAPLRDEALDAMLARHLFLLGSPAVWDRMTADDWDFVPQPVRALAFRHMAEYWSGYYQVGARYAIPRGTIADTLSAILMSESWFDHRAVNVNPWGNRDLGLAQAADRTRERMLTLYDTGEVDVRFEERDYFDPWRATQFIALWMQRLLDETEGDLDMAIRAYHRGSWRAKRGEGDEYLAGVARRLHRFIRNEGADGAWSHLWTRDRALVHDVRPWLE